MNQASVVEQSASRPSLPPARLRRLAAALAATAALASPLLARGDALSVGLGGEPIHLGSGAGDLLIAGRNAAPLSFHLQANVLTRLRLEVSAAYFRVARDKAHTPQGGSAYDFSATAAGFAALYDLALPSPIGFFTGARLTVAQYKGNFMDAPLPLDAPGVTATDVFCGPVIGAELRVARRLFVGTELALTFSLIGDGSARTRASANTPNVAGAHFSADNVFFVRYLLF
ncbi:MAG: hypothetical protein ACJ79R_02320 [Anaeromyxobacteraceae bacterium]